MFEHLCSITNPKELITYCEKHMKEAIINPVGCRVFTHNGVKVLCCVLGWGWWSVSKKRCISSKSVYRNFKGEIVNNKYIFPIFLKAVVKVPQLGKF